MSRLTRTTCAILAVVACTGLVMAGCAQRPDAVSGSYVSSLQYQSYSCDQLAAELARINARAAEVAGVQQKAATTDAVSLGAGLVLFWPAMFFMIGGDRAEELARLKGEIEAIEQTAIQKECLVVAEQIDRQREEARTHPSQAPAN